VKRAIAVAAALAALLIAVPAASARSVPQGFFGVMYDHGIERASDGVQDEQWDLMASSGPPGSLCVRLWTVTKPGTTPPDYLVCATARADGETMRGSVFKSQPGEPLSKVGVAIVGRTSDRTMTLRFSQTVVGRPKTIESGREK